MKKMKRVLVVLLVIALVATGAAYIFNVDNSIQNIVEMSPTPDKITTDYSENSSVYQHYLDNISSGGPPKDGIPPIEEAKYTSIHEAMDRMKPFDKVFVYEGEDSTYLYPQNILVWHEIVNDVIEGEQVSITYCPLTGSTICYLGDVAQHDNNTYGTSGKLLNSNLVMYDRATDSYIPQIFGTGINGPLEGISLDTRPIHWANWEDAILAYPEAKVLSDETGFLRDYDRDPYGSYQPEDNKSYYANDGVMFPLMNQHEGLYSDKKVVIGVKGKDAVTALDPMKVRNDKVLYFAVGSENVVAFWDDALKTVRVYNPEFEGSTLEFSLKGTSFIDQLEREWNIKGQGTEGQQLSTVTYFDVMWFAWFAYYPETEVIQ